jgi:hypothetical protein
MKLLARKSRSANVRAQKIKEREKLRSAKKREQKIKEHESANAKARNLKP